MGIDFVFYVTLDVFFIFLFDADLVSAFQSDKRIMSARETYRNGIRKETKELDEFSRYVFTTFVKRIDVNSNSARSCRINHVRLEKALQLFLVPIPFSPKLSLGFTSMHIERSKS